MEYIRPLFAADIRRERASRLGAGTQLRKQPDEVFVNVNGQTHYFRRAVDHEGKVLHSVVMKTRDRKAALKFPIASPTNR